MSDSDPRPIDLRPAEFVVTAKDPFESDRLNRKDSVESLCSIIDTAQQPLAVTVEGAYGSGKSSFLRMCAARLEGPGAFVVEFNAWQQGHTGRPLIDVVAALSSKLEANGALDRLKDAAKQAGWRAAGYLSRGIIAPGDADDSSVFDDWADIDKSVTEFKASLTEQVEGLDGNKLVILVDELDRCEPTYALDLLNKARHLLDVDGVVIVFGVNRVELGHAVETVYGPGCDVYGYLRRFVDLSMQLPQPTSDEWAAYMTSICGSLLDCSNVLGNKNNVVRKLLTLVADNCGGKLRDVEQIVRHANLTLPLPNYKELWPLWVVCLLALRYVDRDCYDRFVSGSADEWEVLQTLRTHLPVGDALSRPATLDAIVLTLPGKIRMPFDMEEFNQQYTTATGRDEADATEAFRFYFDLTGRTEPDRLPSLQVLHKTIEIAKPT